MAAIHEFNLKQSSTAFNLAGEKISMEVAARCPCCGSLATQPLYRVPSVPIHSCILLNSAKEARALPRRELNLIYCGSCGFLFNEAFDETVMRYSTDFEESQHFSGVFDAFAKTLASEIAQRCAVSGKKVVEIGCGKGEFLQELCRVGGALGLGIDPGYRPDIGRIACDSGVTFLTELFHPESHCNADVILCRHTLEHIAPVAEFIRSIRDSIGPRDDTWVVFETPDVKRILAEGAFWDMYYEHCSYFSPGTHAWLFRQEGFEVTDVSLRYGEQYIVQYAKPKHKHTRPCIPLEHDLEEMHGLAENYPGHVKEVQDMWRDRVRSTWADGHRVVLWGGGSKGVSFITTLGLDEEISAIVDINPYKQGKFMPGTGHRVVAPNALIDLVPDLVIVMNPIYVDEIASTLKAFDLAPEILAVGQTASLG